MKILFIDDELYFMQPYVKALKGEPNPMDVDVVNTAVEAIKILSNIADGGYDCLVLDVMMPPPPGWEARTQDGMFTGIELVKEYQDNVAAIGLPVLILSNIGLATLAPKVQPINLGQNNQGKKLLEACSKISTPPQAAKKLVLDLIGRRNDWLNNPNC